MSLLIDGYNLLHASGILGRGVGPGSLERSRNALLNFLAESLTEKQLSRTTVVFDAREAPPGLPRTIVERGITVRFAPKGLDADSVIEELIEAESSPRRLTVVSSDHRLHRAARRRRAKAIDSDVWYGEVIRLRIERARKKKHSGKPTGPISDVEVRYWLHEFGVTPVAVELEPPDEPSVPQPPDAATDSRPHAPADDKLKDAPPGNPFPPGYAEDITEDEV
jgi:predicted RNA-binding protein with PIN domain